MPEVVAQEDLMQTTSKQTVFDLAYDEEQPAASPRQLQTCWPRPTQFKQWM